MSTLVTIVPRVVSTLASIYFSCHYTLNTDGVISALKSVICGTEYVFIMSRMLYNYINQ